MLISSDTITFYQNGKPTDEQNLDAPISNDQHNPTEFALGARYLTTEDPGEAVDCAANLAHVKVTVNAYRDVDVAEEVDVHNPGNKLCPTQHYERRRAEAFPGYSY